MNINKDVYKSLINSNTILNVENKEKNDSKDKAKKVLEKRSYGAFCLVNEYVESSDKKEILSSCIMNNAQETIMCSSDEIEIIFLGDAHYLFNSGEQALIIEIENGEVEVLTSVSRLESGVTYKLTEYLNKNGLVVLADYNKDEKRIFEYLYNFKTGKRISSGFDTIDEINGRLKVTYGLATGDLDLEGNFVMEPDTASLKPKGFFAKLFSKDN